ncbi:MAG TPA: hypothetical protein VHT92_08135 [Candidatus Cybelea sp.]|jgi:hypothetical protein|nr:hypothetical protein [Candidatus Cybelea sp.]
MRAIALCICAALLAGCGSAAPFFGGSESGAAALAAARTGAANDALLYVANNTGSGGDEVYVYALSSGKLVQTLAGLPGVGGLCTDVANDVFVPMNTSEAIREYRHGGKNPVATLVDPKGLPVDCSVDPTTGDLAVVSDCTPYTCDYGNVAIYTAARGKPKYNSPSNMQNEYNCGYDDLGDLFVAGMTPGAFALAELPRQGKKFVPISNEQPIGFPGGVKWVGKHLLIADAEKNVVYQFDIRGRVAKRVGTIQLLDMKHVEGYSISNDTLYAADANGLDVAFYHYPAGGKPFKKIYGFDDPISTAVSL